jgi:hypothetical protein
MTKFSGFARPKSNFYRLPNDWFDIWRQAREAMAQGSQPARVVGPLKIVEYVIKYTWGRTNFDEPIRMSRSDLRQGVRGRQNRRLDKGTGLGSEATISRGISTAIELGLLEQVENNDDPGRQERLYLPRLRPPEEDEAVDTSLSKAGFERPTANFFLVPNYWSDISADIRSEILIIAMEYFFRHSWGWQVGEHEIRWLDVDDVANGRKYRSDARRGDRYDDGIGYTIRKLRDALEEGVQRELLVWRQGQSGKEYALRMTWMEGIGPNGYFDDTPEDIILFEDQTVEVKDQVVEGRDQNVVGQDQTVEARDQTVGRTYKDTIQDIQNKKLTTNTVKTTTAKHRKPNGAVVGQSSKEETFIFFRPELSNNELGYPEKLTPKQAAQSILGQNGGWYWSQADLDNPHRANQVGFTPLELTAQAEVDKCLLGRNQAVWDDGRRQEVLSLVEIARRSALSGASYPPPVIYTSLWQLLDLPEPNGVWGETASRRRETLQQLQQQADTWGDPDLITALEQINISADEARSLVAQYGAGLVGSWLRSLRANAGNVRSLAAVLISRLSRGLSPPGGVMKVVGGSDDG